MAAKEVESDSYDLAVIGGGIHGLCVALIALERGHRVVVVERGAPGAATTAGWFGILHGGMRYLQSLDVVRFRHSMLDRRWFMRRFPGLIRPQPFLMPLYDRGLKRSEVFRLALLADAVLAADRNRGVARDIHVPRGRVVSTDRVLQMAPMVIRDRLRGGACWSEAVVIDHGALIGALCERIRATGGRVETMTTALRPVVEHGQVRGLVVCAGDDERTVRTDRVLNAAGVWAGPLARAWDPAFDHATPSALGFNLELAIRPPADCALSLFPPDGSDMLFAYPRGTGLFVGTWYLPCAPGFADFTVPEDAVQAALAEVRAALPGLVCDMGDVVHVSSGFLPAAAWGGTRLVDRDLVHDHGRHGGPAGLITQWGIKYTTAPSVGDLALKMAALG